MAMSGVELDPECKIAYDSVQLGHQYRYVTFKIENGKVRIDKVSKVPNPGEWPMSAFLLPLAEGRRRSLLRHLPGRPEAERRRGGRLQICHLRLQVCRQHSGHRAVLQVSACLEDRGRFSSNVLYNPVKIVLSVAFRRRVLTSQMTDCF